MQASKYLSLLEYYSAESRSDGKDPLKRGVKKRIWRADGSGVALLIYDQSEGLKAGDARSRYAHH